MLPFSGSIFFLFLRGSLAPNVLKSGVLREVFTTSSQDAVNILNAYAWMCLYGSYMGHI